MKKMNFLKLVFIVSNNTVHIIPDKHGGRRRGARRRARRGEACARTHCCDYVHHA
jgi:hypothetical protein